MIQATTPAIDSPPPSQAASPAADDARSSRIDAALDERLRPADDRPERLLEAMRYAVLGPGKRLRPRLVVMAAEAAGGSIDEALPAACAVEFVHAYSLIHDDLPAMDDDDLRRGRPTVHKAFDEATAILAGDALQALAFESLAGLAPERAARCSAELARAIGVGGLVGGQADDLDGAAAVESADDAARLAWLRRIHARKTGRLIEASTRLGAIAAGGDAGAVAALGGYGRALGLLFQVTDDLLDASGDAAAVGKRVGKDVDRGKLTYPLVLGIERSRDYAEELAADAVRALEGRGERAEPLRRAVRQVLERDR